MTFKQFISATKFWVVMAIIITTINLIMMIAMINRQEQIADKFEKTGRDIHKSVRDQMGAIMLIHEKLELEIHRPAEYRDAWYYSK